MVNLWYTQTKDGFVIAIDADRLQTGMDSPTSEAMAPDEMYLMLQADMISIKQQEQALQSEIEEISSKFHQLLESVGIDSDGGSGTMAPPSTPSFMKTTAASLTHVTNLETPTFMKSTPGKSSFGSLSDSSDDESRSFFAVTTDSKIDQIVNETDGLPLDISTLSSKTLVVDNNSNYIDSPHSELNDNDTPIIEAVTHVDHLSPPSTNSSTGSSSSSSHRMSSSSDGYPKSDESTDNQIVPECYDLDKEFMSRLQYYSDFTIDRQRKINSIVSNLCTSSDNSPVKEDISTRHVEGKESSPEKPAPIFTRPIITTTLTSGSSSDVVSTPPSRHGHRVRPARYRHPRTGRKRSSQPLASSTMLEDSFTSSSSGRSSHRGGSSLVPKASSTMIFESGSSSSGSRKNRTSGSNPRACSTMLNESFLSSGSAGSGSSRQKSLPVANSTMITEQSAILPHGAEPTISIIRADSKASLHSDNDCESVFTWSIHDDNSGSDRDISLEESFMNHQTKGQKKTSHKPPLPPMKRVRSSSGSSRDSDSEKVCQDHKLHKLLGEPCSRNIHECISVIEPNQTSAVQNPVFIDSMYTDTDNIVKSNTLPRSSTKIKLQDNSTGSSSMEARRASLPDLTNVYSNDDHSVPESSVSEEDCTALPERLECQGKSSSSNDNNGGGLDPSQGSQGSANVDSILTDSPNSVSSGINAPYNSPGTNISSSSRVSCSTTSDAKSSDSNINTKAPQVNILPRNIPVDSPKVQNIEPHQSRNPVFKIPKQNQPLRQLFRFKRKSKTPEVKTSTPKDAQTVSNGQCNSKRQLFPSAATTNLQQQEVRLRDKKAVIRKFKKFSDSIRKTDKTGKPQFETLANL